MNLRWDSFHSAKLSQLCYRKSNAFLNPTGLTRHWAFKRNNKKLFIALRMTKNLNMCKCSVDRKFNKANLCISVWYGNATNQDCKALQRVVRLAERISGSALPSLQDIYLKRCKSRAVKIIKDSNHPGNHLFRLLPSGKRFRSMMARTERLRRSFFPQAIRLLNTNSV